MPRLCAAPAKLRSEARTVILAAAPRSMGRPARLVRPQDRKVVRKIQKTLAVRITLLRAFSDDVIRYILTEPFPPASLGKEKAKRFVFRKLATADL